MKLKPVIAAEHAINWYLGNYLEDPDNALRDDEEIPPKWLEDIADLRKELSEQKMTHRQFLDLVKEKGIQISITNTRSTNRLTVLGAINSASQGKALVCF